LPDKIRQNIDGIRRIIIIGVSVVTFREDKMMALTNIPFEKEPWADSPVARLSLE